MEREGIPLDKQYRSWKQIVKEPVNKLDIEACRSIQMAAGSKT